ncbi:MAG TPA: hypothetical protein P5526_06315 [Anaerolineae bacterium]|nr:hypothetical protein [Anaerolineae bacterium]MCB0182221.1 hypothetical protein [Anaerolineae bacterium]MCB0223409.1 hypothetical protein [Anaerolineae bacterium]MCB9105653.1 hypothetical protein [Anaerolineales bacterium]HRV91758.1 hypothetical protein [Anaerolineae bacterium]
MASRKLTPGSYVVFGGLIVLALIVAVVSFVIPFMIYPAVGQEEAVLETEADFEPAGLPPMYTPEPPANAEAAKEFQDQIVNSYVEVAVPETTEEATVEATEEATTEPTVEATEEAAE